MGADTNPVSLDIRNFILNRDIRNFILKPIHHIDK
jgi:hypothetical protein